MNPKKACKHNLIRRDKKSSPSKESGWPLKNPGRFFLKKILLNTRRTLDKPVCQNVPEHTDNSNAHRRQVYPVLFPKGKDTTGNQTAGRDKYHRYYLCY